jgi:hypothetical protein
MIPPVRDGAGHGGGAIGGDERGRFGKLHQGGRRFAMDHCAVRAECAPTSAGVVALRRSVPHPFPTDY